MLEIITVKVKVTLERKTSSSGQCLIVYYVQAEPMCGYKVKPQLDGS